MSSPQRFSGPNASAAPRPLLARTLMSAGSSHVVPLSARCRWRHAGRSTNWDSMLGELQSRRRWLPAKQPTPCQTSSAVDLRGRTRPSRPRVPRAAVARRAAPRGRGGRTRAARVMPGSMSTGSLRVGGPRRRSTSVAGRRASANQGSAWGSSPGATSASGDTP